MPPSTVRFYVALYFKAGFRFDFSPERQASTKNSISFFSSTLLMPKTHLFALKRLAYDRSHTFAIPRRIPRHPPYRFDGFPTLFTPSLAYFGVRNFLPICRVCINRQIGL